MRVIAGRYRGLTLKTVPGRDVRPTLDRVREALFSILGDRVAGAAVLDLFAGSGALGIEALSRGAASVHFVESGPAVLPVLCANMAKTGWADAEVHAGPVERELPAMAAAGLRFDLVLLDPPYRQGLVEVTLGCLARAGVVSAGGLVAAEHEVRLELPVRVPPLVRTDLRTWGDTSVSFYLLPKEEDT